MSHTYQLFVHQNVAAICLAIKTQYPETVFSTKQVNTGSPSTKLFNISFELHTALEEPADPYLEPLKSIKQHDPRAFFLQQVAAEEVVPTTPHFYSVFCALDDKIASAVASKLAELGLEPFIRAREHYKHKEITQFILTGKPSAGLQEKLSTTGLVVQVKEGSATSLAEIIIASEDAEARAARVVKLGAPTELTPLVTAQTKSAIVVYARLRDRGHLVVAIRQMVGKAAITTSINTKLGVCRFVFLGDFKLYETVVEQLLPEQGERPSCTCFEQTPSPALLTTKNLLARLGHTDLNATNQSDVLRWCQLPQIKEPTTHTPLSSASALFRTPAVKTCLINCRTERADTIIATLKMLTGNDNMYTNKRSVPGTENSVVGFAVPIDATDFSMFEDAVKGIDATATLNPGDTITPIGDPGSDDEFISDPEGEPETGANAGAGAGAGAGGTTTHEQGVDEWEMVPITTGKIQRLTVSCNSTDKQAIQQALRTEAHRVILSFRAVDTDPDDPADEESFSFVVPSGRDIQDFIGVGNRFENCLIMPELMRRSRPAELPPTSAQTPISSGPVKGFIVLNVSQQQQLADVLGILFNAKVSNITLTRTVGAEIHLTCKLDESSEPTQSLVAINHSLRRERAGIISNTGPWKDQTPRHTTQLQITCPAEHVNALTRNIDQNGDGEYLRYTVTRADDGNMNLSFTPPDLFLQYHDFGALQGQFEEWAPDSTVSYCLVKSSTTSSAINATSIAALLAGTQTIRNQAGATAPDSSSSPESGKRPSSP